MKKKDILFYTFLLTFIITAAITLLGIVEVIQIKAGYLNTLVGVFVVELAGAVIALFRKADFFTEGVAKSKAEQEEQHATSDESMEEPDESMEETAEPPPHCDLSATEYFRRIHDLEDRFHEREEFIKKYNGHTVHWAGFVETVSTTLGNILIHMYLNNSVAPDAPLFEIPKSIIASVPNDLRTKAYALQRGDYIVATGVLDNQPAMAMIGAMISNASFDLERKANSPGTSPDLSPSSPPANSEEGDRGGDG